MPSSAARCARHVVGILGVDDFVAGFELALDEFERSEPIGFITCWYGSVLAGRRSGMITSKIVDTLANPSSNSGKGDFSQL